MTQQITKSIRIDAAPAAIWDILTTPALMKQWMGDAEMEIEIFTDWKVGNPILTKGFHHVRFENKGTILKFEPYIILSYNYLSSISNLPDKPENYTTLEFLLEPKNNKTLVSLTISNFPTEVIFKHIDFYWGTTLEIIKKLIGKQNG